MARLKKPTLLVYANPSLGITDPGQVPILEGVFYGRAPLYSEKGDATTRAIGAVEKVTGVQEMLPGEQRTLDRGLANLRSQRVFHVLHYHGVPATEEGLAEKIAAQPPVEIPNIPEHRKLLRVGAIVAADKLTAQAAAVEFVEPKEKLVSDCAKAIAAYNSNHAHVSADAFSEYRRMRAEADANASEKAEADKSANERAEEESKAALEKARAEKEKAAEEQRKRVAEAEADRRARAPRSTAKKNDDGGSK